MATVLVVEDRPIDRRLLVAILRSGGHATLEASDGADALRALASHAVDLIISDVLMPSIDGYELVRRIRDQPALARIPVIFYTATYHAREAQRLAAQCGVAAVLTKPSTPDVILAAVNRAAGTTGPVPAPTDRDQFDRNHFNVVISALAAKTGALEAGEQQMAAIIDIARELTAESKPAALLQKVCDASRSVSFAQHAVLGLLDETGEQTAQLFTSGLGADERARLGVPPLDGTPLERIVFHRQAVRLDPASDPDRLLDRLRESSIPTRSFLGVPLATTSRVYGWLVMRNKLGADTFSERDEDIASALATHAAVAYENARFAADRAEREERTRFALEAAHTGIWERDLATDRVTWSNIAPTAFGLPSQAVPATGADFLALVHPDDRPAFADAIDRAIKEHTDLVAEFRVVSADGATRWVFARARTVYDSEGRALRLIGVNVDITERKSLEAQLRQAQKMEAIGQLAGGIAHDFNNMLTAILGNANLILDDAPPDAVQRDEALEIVRAAERASALTRQLLAFGRKQMMQPAAVDLNALVIDMSQMLKRLIGEHIELVTSLESPLPIVRADPSQIEQVVLNLVVNARDAMLTGGRLSLTTAAFDLDDEYVMEHVVIEPGRYVMLAVSDTGTGMTEETKRRVFEPFFTTKERGKGTGLGLATVYGIVKQSGGYVWVYSEWGHGTTLKVYLPVAAEADRPARRTPAAAAVPQRGTGTILLVEDEVAVRQLAKILLERSGYHVLVAADAQEAADLFQRHADRIDLLVTDVVMPGASGPALLRHLLDRRPGLKVLYMSGYATDAVPLHTVDSDAVFLQKPFTSDQLIRKVHEALAR
jgi:PAS domain S-box-containing protein